MSSQLSSDAPALPGSAPAADAATLLAEPLPLFKVSGIFSSHMVLQQGRPITVWGWCSHIGAAVTGEWDGETVQTAVDDAGRFALTFAPRPASFTPTQMRIASHWGAAVFTDILVGDVWVIGGQSNAELTLAPCLVKTPWIVRDICPQDPFRLFIQTQAGAAADAAHHHRPARDIIRPEWRWQRPHLQAAKSFSALGYSLARLLTHQVDIPIGMVMMAAGGACLRELMPVELAAARGYDTGANVPVAGYYNTLIAPLLGLQFKGQIFFQGESEGIWKEMALSYDEDLAAFVEDERRRFGFDFPFYNVQLCTYRTEGKDYFPHLHWVRTRQERARHLIPGYHLAVSRDLGAQPQDPDFAHSYYKYPLAQRLAALVLANAYGVGDDAMVASPLPVAATRCGTALQVRFDHTAGGLQTPNGGAPVGFAFMDAAGQMLPAAAAITGPDTVTVQIPEPLLDAAVPIDEVYYAMDADTIADMTRADLCAANGLPAPAFALPITQG